MNMEKILHLKQQSLYLSILENIKLPFDELYSFCCVCVAYAYLSPLSARSTTLCIKHAVAIRIYHAQRFI